MISTITDAAIDSGFQTRRMGPSSSTHLSKPPMSKIAFTFWQRISQTSSMTTLTPFKNKFTSSSTVEVSLEISDRRVHTKSISSGPKNAFNSFLFFIEASLSSIVEKSSHHRCRYRKCFECLRRFDPSHFPARQLHFRTHKIFHRFVVSFIDKGYHCELHFCVHCLNYSEDGIQEQRRD